ncbi:MAG: citrate lyase subunit alpha [Eubacteriales bacterium]|nr:citrate lyase subunit alpha [Eubacteriales bacterium]
MKVYSGSLENLIRELSIKDGSRLSFHHHMRDGDYVLNAVMAAVAASGAKNLTLNASALFNCHEPLLQLIRDGVVTAIECNYMAAKIGQGIAAGILEKPVTFRSHGTRPAAIASGETPVDYAFIAAPQADYQGNLSGKYGPSACGSLGYAMADAAFAKKVIAITDDLSETPLADFSIPGSDVDQVVVIDAIGDPQGIVSGTTKISRDPKALLMADMAVSAIAASGLLKEGFSFQTGAGGASLATAARLRQLMLKEEIEGSFALGGITGYLVEMLEQGLFQTLYDVQCFDLRAVQSIRDNPKHREVSAIHYAAANPRGALVDYLDVVILGATEIDLDFNVNVHTDSNGLIMGGSGGHSDAAAGAKIAMIIAPLLRSRMPLIVDRLQCISTPGETIDCLLTQYGIAVNPRRADLAQRFKERGLPVLSIEELQAKAEQIAGKPSLVERKGRVLADILYRDGQKISEIRQ